MINKADFVEYYCYIILMTKKEFIMAEIIITEENFEKEVLDSDKPVIVDFWAQWCAPCKMLAPIIAEIAKENEAEVKVGKIDIDDQSALAQRFSIASIPTIVVFKNGRAVNTAVGLLEKKEVLGLLN